MQHAASYRDDLLGWVASSVVDDALDAVGKYIASIWDYISIEEIMELLSNKYAEKNYLIDSNTVE